jgi:ATP-dependent DNA helicase RecQ
VSRLVSADADNPWLAELKDILEDLATAVGGRQIAAMEAVEWLHDSAGARAREAPGHLNLCTAHAAKGREFKHVLVLDTGDWTSTAPEERRLLYVAMTRAKETLTLLQRTPGGNPLLASLDPLEAVRTLEPKLIPMREPALDRIHRTLTLADVDLGFAGRFARTHPVHRALARLRVEDPLRIDGRELRNAEGQVVGRLAKKCELPHGRVQSVKVNAIVCRTERQTQDPKYRAALKVPEWEVVLTEIVMDSAKTEN